MTRRTLLILIAVALVVGGIFLARVLPGGETPGGQPQDRKPLPVVQVAAVSREAIAVGLNLTGSAEPRRVARPASPAEGPVTDLRVREGDRVETGDTLLAIGRTRGVDARITSLLEELRKEDENLRATRELVESGALPGEELDQARASHERVRALLIQAQETAGDFRVLAPWRGVVSRLMVEEGDFVVPRTPLLEMYDAASLVIRTAVPEQYAAEVRAGMDVDVALDAYPGMPISGRVAHVYPFLDERMRTRTLEIDLAESVDLLPGMFARLTLRLTVIEDAMVAPVEAVIAGPGGQSAVFVVEQGKALRRPVQTGIEEGRRVQILMGLSEGEKIVVAGHEKLKDGAEVRVAEPGAGVGAGAGAGAARPGAAAGGPADRDGAR